MSKTQKILPALVAVLLLGVFGGPYAVWAQDTEGVTDPEILYMCYVKGTGVVYRVNPPDHPGLDPDIKDECSNQRHVPFSWTVGVDGHDHGALNGLEDDDHSEYVREGEAADGDLGGTYPDPTVTKLQGEPLSLLSTEPNAVLTWTGTEWTGRVPEEGITDHGQLEGREDDDHPQYLLRTEAPDGHSLDAVDGDPVDAITVDENGDIHFGPKINSLHHSIDFYVEPHDLGSIYVGEVEAFRSYGATIRAGFNLSVGEGGIESEGGIRVTGSCEPGPTCDQGGVRAKLLHADAVGVQFPDGSIQETAAAPSWGVAKALATIWVGAGPDCVALDGARIRYVRVADNDGRNVWCDIGFEAGVVSSFPFLTAQAPGPIEDLHIEVNDPDHLIFGIRLLDESIPATVYLVVF